MKLQNSILKWAIGLVLSFTFLGSTTISPSVYAQGEASSTITETPTAISIEGTVVPTITPTPTSEESFTPLQNEEQPFAMAQSLEENENRLNPEHVSKIVSDM
ncbi:MAG: hypothetical protein IT311_04415 [Anaerolineales bacterium]|nr:hypothetical protein [Anaerolineales bacterium]MCZ2120988.1 hypothetical protein [Anaerolineales bacterium]